MRRQRRDWQGKILQPSSQIIEHARDVLPQNLCTFNLISYDKMKSTPRDGKFYKCPECGTIIYTAFPEQRKTFTGMEDIAPTCPGNPLFLNDPVLKMSTCSHRIAKWKEENRTKGRTKHRILLGEDGEPLKTEEGKNVKTHWMIHTEKFPVESRLGPECTKVVDDRPPKPTIPIMEPLEHIHKKMETVIIGWNHDDRTGEKQPILKQVERDFHVKWTFAELVRGRFNTIAADEALYFVNEEAKRSQAVYHLTGKTRWPLTGTPMKGNPDSILPLINWTIRREAFPGYRNYDRGGRQKWMNKYKTEVMVDGVMTEDGQMVGGRKKLLPKINNPELFQAEIAPFMLRHVRNEPNVIKDIPKKQIVSENLSVPMDPAHRAYYEKWLQSFAEWWEEMKREKEGKSVKGQLIVKMNYLFNASSVPHHMLDEIMSGKDDVAKGWAQKIGKYKGPLTAKMKHCFKMVRENVEIGDKTIVFSSRQKNTDNGHLWATKSKLNSMAVDGRTSLSIKPGETRSQRHNMVQDFRNMEYHVMWAGIGALAEGMNIPEANRGIILDPSWKPSEPRQAIGRMIRPQQTKIVYSTFLMHKGTIEEYMAAVCYLKARSQDEGVDFMEFSDFKVDIIPDISQYADWIVDGTEEKNKAKMWLAVDYIKKQQEEEGEESI